MATRNASQITPYERYFHPIECFKQPSILTNAHSRIQQRLRAICYRHSITLHTGVYRLSASELPIGPWTMAYMPQFLANGSSMVMFVHPDSEFLWYYFPQTPWPADETVKSETMLYLVVAEGTLVDAGKIYIGNGNHKKFHTMAEGILWKHHHQEDDRGRFNGEWQAVH
jgi:hypothetical protein